MDDLENDSSTINNKYKKFNYDYGNNKKNINTSTSIEISSSSIVQNDDSFSGMYKFFKKNDGKKNTLKFGDSTGNDDDEVDEENQKKQVFKRKNYNKKFKKQNDDDENCEESFGCGNIYKNKYSSGYLRPNKQGYSNYNTYNHYNSYNNLNNNNDSSDIGNGFKNASEYGNINKKKKEYNENKEKDGNIGNDIDEEVLKERITCKKFVPPKSVNNYDNKKTSGNSLKQKEKTGKGDSDSDSEDPRVKGIDKKLVSFIEGEILSSNPNVKWNDISGLEHAKTAIKEIIIWPLLRPDIFKGIRKPPKGLLLFGPPGTGKTMIAKAIASEAKAKFFNISASSLTSKWLGESEKLARCLFALASHYQPSVIFVDEIDSILSARSENENESSRRLKTEFLVQLDGAGTNQSDQVLIIGATNRPHEIDDAVIRRMTKRLYIPLPNFKSRKDLILNIIKSEEVHGSKYEITKLDIDEISKKSYGYSGCDLYNICREASMIPLRAVENIIDLDYNCIRAIDKSDFISAINSIKSSVAIKSLSQYETWNKEFGTFQFDYENEEE